MRIMIILSLIVLAFLPTAATTGWGTEEIKQNYEFDRAVAGAQKIQDAAATADASNYAKLIEYRASQSKYIFYECVLLSVVAIASLVIVIRHISGQSGNPAHIVSASGLVLIIFGTILLVLLTDAESQLTAGIGVMGAIAGYLFGKMQGDDAKKAG